VGALSLATDLGLGQPQQHIIRQTLIAMRMRSSRGCPTTSGRDLLCVALRVGWLRRRLLRDGQMVRDDTALRADSYLIDKTGLSLMGS